MNEEILSIRKNFSELYLTDNDGMLTVAVDDPDNLSSIDLEVTDVVVLYNKLRDWLKENYKPNPPTEL